MMNFKNMSLPRVPLFIAAASLSLLCGCSVLNPYQENFSCRSSAEDGGCFDVRTAYSHAKATEHMDQIDVPPPALAEDGKYGSQIEGSTPALVGTQARSQYKDAVYNQLKDLVQAEVTPMLSPPKVLRVSFIPYEDQDGVLFLGDDAFIVVENPKWVLDGKLTNISNQ